MVIPTRDPIYKCAFNTQKGSHKCHSNEYAVGLCAYHYHLAKGTSLVDRVHDYVFNVTKMKIVNIVSLFF